MTTLFLIRHGWTAQTGSRIYGRTPGIHLDERGRAQAEGLVRRFEGVRLTALYTSPLERCVETLEPLAAARGLELQRRDGLLEMDTGAWTGRSLAQIRRLRAWSRVQSAPSWFTFPEGEGFSEALARIVRTLAEIVEQHPRGAVGVSTHGDIVRMALAHASGAGLDQFQRIIVDPGSVSVLATSGATPMVLATNDAGTADLKRFGTRRGAPGAGGARRSQKLRG